MEEWIVRMSEQAKMAKLTCLIKGKTTSTFTKALKFFMVFLLKIEKSEVMIYEFDD